MGGILEDLDRKDRDSGQRGSQKKVQWTVAARSCPKSPKQGRGLAGLGKPRSVATPISSSASQKSTEFPRHVTFQLGPSITTSRAPGLFAAPGMVGRDGRRVVYKHCGIHVFGFCDSAQPWPPHAIYAQFTVPCTVRNTVSPVAAANHITYADRRMLRGREGGCAVILHPNTGVQAHLSSGGSQCQFTAGNSFLALAVFCLSTVQIQNTSAQAQWHTPRISPNLYLAALAALWAAVGEFGRADLH